MHEIVTLQLGQQANYLGTHFWNTQESYFTYSADEESLVDHDIHFRPGYGPDGGETYTPRTVIYDLKGGFGSLKKINALYEATEDGPPQGVWNGPTVLQRQTQITQNPYQRSLEEGGEAAPLTPETVRYWSDFNRVYFHPRSIVQLNDYDLNSSLMPFEKFNTGEELFDTLDKEHDLLDRDLRPFAEECDYMQGIQIMTSLDDAWGGFATRYLDRIRDEFGKTTVWVWGMEEGMQNVPKTKQLLRLSNTAQSIAGLIPQASLVIPLAIPIILPSYINIQRNCSWHTSALMCTVMESITLPSRLKPRNGIRQTLDDVAASLNVNGNQNLTKLRLTIEPSFTNDKMEGVEQIRDERIPAANGRAEKVVTAEDEEVVYDMDFFSQEDYFPHRSRGPAKKPHTFGQSDVYRTNNKVDDTIADDRDGYDRAHRRAAGLPVTHKQSVPLAFPLLDSFPDIYSFPPDNTRPSSVAVQTSFVTNTTVSLRIKGLRTIASRSLGIEEREALTNSLGEIAEAYEEGYDSGSDSDDD